MFAPRTFSAVRFLCVASFALIASQVAMRPAQASFDATTTYNVNNMEVVSISLDGTRIDAYAGAFQTTLHDASGMTVSSPLTTYCVDLAHELAKDEQVNVTAISTLAGGNGAYVGSLYANFAAKATSAVNSAALQLAIWKTEYDGPNATNNCGHFVLLSAPQAVIDQAIFYYENNKLVANDIAYLQTVAGTEGQSLVGPGTNAVPEPASVAMLGLGLVAGVGGTIRQRRATRRLTAA